MPNWENYSEKAREWYKKRRKKIGIACILSFVISVILFVVSFMLSDVNLELSNVILSIVVISLLCCLILFFLIAIGEGWEIGEYD